MNKKRKLLIYGGQRKLASVMEKAFLKIFIYSSYD